MGCLLQNEFGAPKDTTVQLVQSVHQAIRRPGVLTMLKIVLHEITFKKCWCTWCTNVGALIRGAHYNFGVGLMHQGAPTLFESYFM